MRSTSIQVLFILLLIHIGTAKAQETAERETDIHNNVRLLEMPVPPDMPQELRVKYELFVQRLKEALAENTSERDAISALTIQVRPGVKEIGANKTKRALARIAGYRKDSKGEFFGNLYLHSYETGDTVNKKEIERFLTQQIFNPLGMN